MAIKFTKSDRKFLRDLKIKDAEPAALDTNHDWGQQPFDAADMQRRYERLKAEGRLPTLQDVLRIVRKGHEESKQ